MEPVGHQAERPGILQPDVERQVRELERFAALDVRAPCPPVRCCGATLPSSHTAAGPLRAPPMAPPFGAPLVPPNIRTVRTLGRWVLALLVAVVVLAAVGAVTAVVAARHEVRP